MTSLPSIATDGPSYADSGALRNTADAAAPQIRGSNRFSVNLQTFVRNLTHATSPARRGRSPERMTPMSGKASNRSTSSSERSSSL